MLILVIKYGLSLGTSGAVRPGPPPGAWPQASTHLRPCGKPLKRQTWQKIFAS